MTLSLDDVRSKRFRMARKSGYEVLEVDEFVDEVEETFASLVEENTNLKKQIDALKSGMTEVDEPSAPQPADRAQVSESDEGRVSTTVVSSGNGADEDLAKRIEVTTSQEASSAVVRLVQMSTEQSERLVAEADQEAGRIRAEANRQAEQVTGDARTEAERLQADAVVRAEELDRELVTRRADMFGDLEKQRDSLTRTVASLRAFEENYRSGLAEHLRGQLDALDHVSLEPAGGPEWNAAAGESTGDGSQPPTDATDPDDPDDPLPSGEGSSRSDTPRLDALLGEQG